VALSWAPPRTHADPPRRIALLLPRPGARRGPALACPAARTHALEPPRRDLGLEHRRGLRRARDARGRLHGRDRRARSAARTAALDQLHAAARAGRPAPARRAARDLRSRRDPAHRRAQVPGLGQERQRARRRRRCGLRTARGLRAAAQRGHRVEGHDRTRALRPLLPRHQGRHGRALRLRRGAALQRPFRRRGRQGTGLARRPVEARLGRAARLDLAHGPRARRSLDAWLGLGSPR